ncbi:hypothetical protein O9993_03435 [Vibrio lentus]|nr:hypothetical protein [Vibrio lentus]
MGNFVTVAKQPGASSRITCLYQLVDVSRQTAFSTRSLHRATTPRCRLSAGA